MLLLASVCGLLTLSSCKKDEETDKETIVNGSGVAIRSITDKNGNAVQLSQISGEATWDYYYDDYGKLTKVIWGNGSNKPTLFSAPFTSSWKETDDEGYTYEETINYSTNGAGFITKYVSNYSITNKKGAYYFKDEEGTLSYNSSDQLTYVEINRKESGSENHKYLYKVTLVWSDGNLTKVKLISSVDGLETPESTSTISYSSTNNPAKQMPMCLIYEIFINTEIITAQDLRPLIPLGLFGKGPQKVPYNATMYFKNDGTIRSEWGYNYTYSNDKD